MFRLQSIKIINRSPRFIFCGRFKVGNEIGCLHVTGTSALEGRIVNGSDAALGEIPYMVGYYNGNPCGTLE